MSTPKEYVSVVNSLYLAFYGRPADPAGLAFWTEQTARFEGDLAGITASFATSEEAQVRFSTNSAVSRITQIYEQLFNRAPDAAGLAFWTEAVESGRASLADVSLEILKGARGSDYTLSDMRQKAADLFTATVEAGSTQYSGYASIEAARVLVRAVTPGATQDDLDALVKAAVSFADTATRNPQVVEAIATGSTLLGLFDTARGKGDPVALAQALADTAKAAAGDPVTLESLLRGGGMDKVLKVMPAEATLKDVVAALAEGGLPAAVDVVYPPEPPVAVVPTPTLPALSLSFESVAHDIGDANPADHVTNVRIADVSFSYSRALASGQQFEYSTDGQNWHRDGLEMSASGRFVTIKGLDLGAGAPVGGTILPRSVSSPDAGSSASVSSVSHDDLQTVVSLRVVEAGGAPVATTSTAIVYDSHVATPYVMFDTMQADPLLGAGNDITNVPSFTLGGIEAGAKVEYLADAAPAMPGFIMVLDPVSGLLIPMPVPTFPPATLPAWTAEKPVLHEGANSFTVRQTDVAGNVSETHRVQVVLDTQAPAGTPRIALVEDDGASPTDGITSVARLAITGLEPAGGIGWEYSLDDGATWTFGAVNDGSGQAELDLSAMGHENRTVLVRQRDAAGNVGQASDALSFTISAEAPKPAFVLGGSGFTLSVAGTATDAVTVDLTADTIARAGFDSVSHPSDIRLVDASDYAGSVRLLGSAADIAFAAPSFGEGKIAAYGIVDTKAGIFTGAPDQRVFVDGIEALLAGAQSVVLADTLSAQEWALLDGLQGFDMGALDALVDDMIPTAPLVVLDVDSGRPPLEDMDGVTNVGAYTVIPEEGATVQFSVDGLGDWTGDKPVAQEGANAFYVRQIDHAGNVSDAIRFSFTLDTKAPAAPTLALVSDTGIPDDLITAIGDVQVSGLTSGSTFEYRFGPQDAWQMGTTDQNGRAVFTAAGDGDKSVEVRAVDQAGNESAAATLSFKVDANAPQALQPSNLASVGYSLAGNPGALFLNAQDGSIKRSTIDPSEAGFLDKSGLSLVNLVTGLADPAHTSGFAFGIPTDGMLRFGAAIKAGMYAMSWQDLTFATRDGYLKAGQMLFAGGVDGAFSQEGFALSFITPEMNSADNMQFSGAYYGPHLSSTIATGGGQDAVFAAGVDLGIEYRVLQSTAQDLILGFGAGDTILFSGDAAARIERDGWDGIRWADNSAAQASPPGSAWPKVAVDAHDEAVEIVVQGAITSALYGYGLTQTLATLNGAIELSNASPVESLLILAKNGSGGAALLYVDNLNMNTSIDAGELTLVAMFSGGAPDPDQIQLIGSQVGIPGG
ncbi:DUF4214 domain-containing protein [Massilia sp. UMI-21]|nr:DUF4214 domain-containing protein [Massilia sp. UMI-21]